MKDFKSLLALINENNKNECDEIGGVYYCYKCLQTKGQFESITITLNLNVQIQFLPKYYLEYEQHYDRCMLMFKGITGDTLDHWVLGDAFLRPLYQVYDADNYKVGIMTN